MLNKGHEALSAIRAAVLMTLPSAWVAAIRIGYILSNGTATLALFVLVVLITNNAYVVISGRNA